MGMSYIARWVNETIIDFLAIEKYDSDILIVETLVRKFSFSRRLLPIFNIYLSGILTLFIILLTVYAIVLHGDINVLATKITAQQDIIKGLSSDVRNVQSADGTSLQRCLDTAARAFNNTIGTKGQLSVDGKQTSTLTLDEWNGANNQLKADRDKCNELYN